MLLWRAASYQYVLVTGVISISITPTGCMSAHLPPQKRAAVVLVEVAVEGLEERRRDPRRVLIGPAREDRACSYWAPALEGQCERVSVWLVSGE